MNVPCHPTTTDEEEANRVATITFCLAELNYGTETVLPVNRGAYLLCAWHGYWRIPSAWSALQLEEYLWCARPCYWRNTFGMVGIVIGGYIWCALRCYWKRARGFAGYRMVTEWLASANVVCANAFENLAISALALYIAKSPRRCPKHAAAKVFIQEQSCQGLRPQELVTKVLIQKPHAVLRWSPNDAQTKVFTQKILRMLRTTCLLV